MLEVSDRRLPARMVADKHDLCYQSSTVLVKEKLEVVDREADSVWTAQAAIRETSSIGEGSPCQLKASIPATWW
jgi:hypothetical protein